MVIKDKNLLDYSYSMRPSCIICYQISRVMTTDWLHKISVCFRSSMTYEFYIRAIWHQKKRSNLILLLKFYILCNRYNFQKRQRLLLVKHVYKSGGLIGVETVLNISFDTFVHQSCRSFAGNIWYLNPKYTTWWI